MQIGTIKEIWRYPVKSMAGEKLERSTVGLLGLPGDRGWATRDEATGEITRGARIPQLMQCASSYREDPTNDFIPQVEILLCDGSRVSSDDVDVNQKLSAAVGRELTLWPRQPAENLDHYRRKSRAARVVGPLSQLKSFRSLLPAITKLPSISRALREEFSREAGEPVPDISILPPEVIQFTSPPGTYFDAFPIHVLTTASLNAMSSLNPTANWNSRRFRPNFLVETFDSIEGLPEAEWNGRTLRLGTVEIRCEIPTVRCGMATHAQDGIEKDPSILRTIVKEAEQNLGSYANVIAPGRVALGDAVELL